MTPFPLDGVPWDPMYLTQKWFGLDLAWNNLLWFVIGSALLVYAVMALARGELMPLISKRKLKRYELPILALILGMTFLIQAGQPELLSSLLAKVNIDF